MMHGAYSVKFGVRFCFEITFDVIVWRWVGLLNMWRCLWILKWWDVLFVLERNRNRCLIETASVFLTKGTGLPRHSLLLKCHTVTVYTYKCKFMFCADFHETREFSTASSEDLFTEFHAYWKLESAEINSFMSLSKVWLSLAAFTKLTLVRLLFMKILCTEFRENLTDGFVVDNRW